MVAALASSATGMDVTYVGPERSPVIRIDGFLEDPHRLVEAACEAPFIDVGSRYPGVRAPAPSSYVDTLIEKTGAIIRDVFGGGLMPDLELCAFSMVTTAPEKLRPIQRVPHFDGPDTERIAFIHYLCDANQGGTSLYRHRATGLLEITKESVDKYRDTVVRELEADTPVHAYVIDHTRFFERLHSVGAAFNRLIIYRGNALHSGDISARTVLSEDPRRGRLTINGFGFLRLPTFDN